MKKDTPDPAPAVAAKQAWVPDTGEGIHLKRQALRRLLRLPTPAATTHNTPSENCPAWPVAPQIRDQSSWTAFQATKLEGGVIQQ